jgi:hypothetical protein
MSVQFWPCPGCSRHVKRGDAVCPFCGATASIESGPTRTVAGRLSRAALVAAGAVGAAVATTACSPAPPYGTNPYVPNETGDASASDGPSEVAADAGDASTTSEPTDSSSTADVIASTPPYGQGPLPVDE